MRIRIGDLARVVLAIAVEAALLVGLWVAAPILGSVDLSHLATWVRDTDPTTAVLAVFRLAGMIFAGWMLATTVIYLAATLAGAERVARRSGWVTVPYLRRMIDGLAAASILASAFSASSGAASAAPAAPIVQPFTPPGSTAPQHRTMTAMPTTAPPATLVGRQARAGRHIPHPGSLEHAMLVAYSAPVPTVAPQAPNAENGFAGIAPGTKIVVVQPGECLSVIAQQHLDGNWQTGDKEIHALNAGRIQPDGRALTDDHWIYPGWVLVMPGNAVDTEVVPVPALAPPPATAPTLASPVAPVPSFTAVAPSPTSPPPSTAVPAAHASPQTATSGASAQVPGIAAATRPAAVSPAVSDSGDSRPVPAAGSRRGAAPLRPAGGMTLAKPSTAPQPGPSRNHSEDSGSVIPLPVELLGGGIMAAGFVTLLTRLIRVQQGRRRRGRSIRRPSGAQARVELAARVGADHAATHMVDVGCRFLSLQLDGRTAPLPVVLGAEVFSDRLELLLEGPAGEIPEGFDAGDDESTWVWHAPEDIERVAREVANIVPPLPGLVSLGRTDTGITVMANLGVTGLVGLGGDRQAAAEVVASVAVEMATAPWAQQCRVVLVGFGHQEGLGVAEPVELVDRLADCLPSLRVDADELRGLTEEQGFDSIDHLRLAGDPIDSGPTMVLCIDPPGEEEMLELSRLAENPLSGLGAVVVTGTVATGGPWQLSVTAEGLLEVDPLARMVHAQRLPLPLFDTMEARLGVARTTTDVDPTLPNEDWWVPQFDQASDSQAGDDGNSEQAEAVGDEEIDGVTDTDHHDHDQLPGEDLNAADDPPERSQQIDNDDGHHGSEVQPPAPVGDEEPVCPPTADEIGGSEAAPANLRVLNAVGHPEIPLLPAQGCTAGPPDVLVQVLRATPRVLRLVGSEPGEIVVSRARSLEAIVYLACHEEGTSSARLAGALHPERLAEGRTHNTDTFSNELSAARTSLGVDAQGADYLPRKSADRFRLAPTVALDWTIMDRLLDTAEKAADDAERIRLLSAAFALVGDEAPFADVRRQRSTQPGRQSRAPSGAQHWRWFEVEFLADVEQTVIDVACGLAELLLRAGSIREASRVARKGIRISPLNRDLWNIYVSVEAERGHQQLQAARDEMARTFEAEAEPYDTIDVDHLLHHAAHAPARRTS